MVSLISLRCCPQYTSLKITDEPIVLFSLCFLPFSRLLLTLQAVLYEYQRCLPLVTSRHMCSYESIAASPLASSIAVTGSLGFLPSDEGRERYKEGEGCGSLARRYAQTYAPSPWICTSVLFLFVHAARCVFTKHESVRVCVCVCVLIDLPLSAVVVFVFLSRSAPLLFYYVLCFWFLHHVLRLISFLCHFHLALSLTPPTIYSFSLE